MGNVLGGALTEAGLAAAAGDPSRVRGAGVRRCAPVRVVKRDGKGGNPNHAQSRALLKNCPRKKLCCGRVQVDLRSVPGGDGPVQRIAWRWEGHHPMAGGLRDRDKEERGPQHEGRSEPSRFCFSADICGNQLK